MTVSSLLVKTTFAGNASTTVFPSAGIVIFEAADVILWKKTAAGVVTALTLNVDFSVAPVGGTYPATVNITYPLIGSALATGDSLIFYRKLPLTQNTLLSNNGPYLPKTIEQQFDRLDMQDQQLDERSARAIRVPAYDTLVLNDLPVAASRLNQFLYFDATGQVAVAPATAINLTTLKTFSNVAALRLNNLLAALTGQTVAITGYTTAADGGEGLFVYDATDTTTTDNGGTIFVDALGQRWKREGRRGIHSVKWFGATGNGTTDDTTTIQTAINVCQGKEELFFPSGTYLVSSTLTVTAGLKMSAVPWTMNITWASTSLTVMTVAADLACSFRGLGFLGPASAVSGSVLRIDGGGTNPNAQSKFRDLSFLNGFTCITFVSASYWNMEGCTFNQYTSTGLNINDTVAPDTGDMCISNCLFLGKLGNSGSAIQYGSAGGLKITNSKFLTGAVGLNVSLLNTTGGTGDLMVSNCSFEGFTTCGIQFARPAGTLTFSHICITGNQIGLCAAGISFAAPGVGTAFGNVAITGNQIAVNAANSCINLSAVGNFSVTGNTLFANSGGASGTGIQVTSDSSGGKIDGNSFSGLANFVTNGSATTRVALSTQYGSNTVAMAANAYGTLFFSAAKTITFPQSFNAAPDPADIVVNITALTGGLGVAAVILPGTITASQFQFQMLGAANTGSVPFNWAVKGIL